MAPLADLTRTTSGLSRRIRDIASRQETTLVAIDGYGGAGKSVLAVALRQVLPAAAIVEVDDFWLPADVRPDRNRIITEPGSDYDHQRLISEVLGPLSENRPGTYRRYDWPRDACLEMHVVPPGGTVIVEGVFTLLPLLRKYFDFAIWVDTPENVRLERGIIRDGERARDVWENEWMKAYHTYGEKYTPWKRADAVFRGV